MKLKKIASLALAGVMAVSMLAGCATNKPEEKPGEGEGTVTTTSLSTEVGALVEDAPEYVTFADSDKLDSALKAAVEYAGVKDVLPEYIHLNQLTEVNWTTVAQKLSEKLDDENYTEKDLNKGRDFWNWIGYVTNGMDGEEAVASQLYVVSKNVGDTALKEMIAEKLEKAGIAHYMEYDLKGDNWYYDYTVSVSTCTKTVNSSAAAENPTVTFVAVQVVRTAAHQ